MKKFDITIIGGGESGYSAASQAADLGAKVCLIEKENLGGTFLNSGVFTLRKILTTLGFYPSSYSSKDLADLVALSHKIRIDEMKAQTELEKAQAANIKNQTNVQINSAEMPFGQGNYGELMKKLLKDTVE